MLNNANMAQIKSTKQVKDYVLFDRYPFVNATSYSQVDFFALAQGQSSKTVVDTNLKVQGKLDLNQSMEVHSIGLMANPDISSANLKAILKDTLFRLTKSGDIILIEVPAILLCTGAGIQSADSVNVGEPNRSNVFGLNYPITLEEGCQFRAELLFNPAYTAGANLSLMCLLRGDLYKPLAAI